MTSNNGAQRKKRQLARAAGLRAVEIWVPDTGASGFAAECARQARLVREADSADEDVQAWAANSDASDWSA